MLAFVQVLPLLLLKLLLIQLFQITQYLVHKPFVQVHPSLLTGSTATGGNGSITYLWESSTTSASAGFSAASGTNNTQGYTPGCFH